MSLRFLAPLPLAAALFSTHALLAQTAEACSCIQQTLDQQLAQATYVFEGRVTASTGGAPSGDVAGGNEIVDTTFRVTRQWKGVTSETMHIHARTSSAACGYAFAIGESYVVFATEGPNGPTTSLCSGTKLSSEATGDFATLGVGSTPVTVESQQPTTPRSTPPAAGGCGACASGLHRQGIAGVFPIAALGCIAMTRGRRRSGKQRASR